MKLLIAIPALNEEQSIASTIERSLAAGADLVSTGSVIAVDVTVVSDGSTDRTAEIASAYTDRINLIVFEKNRGYGAAIKEAWRRSDAELLGFLDADGTCDPQFFGPLCDAATAGADIAVGCRMTSESRMPMLRRFGNVCFSTLLSALSSQRVRDTASGMRVVRRSVLPRLYPLPDGLQFTPAMSARALLSSDLRLREIDMPYAEREGDSKLAPWRDGVRFLRSILQVAVLFRPLRAFSIVAGAVVIAAAVLLAAPTADFIQNGAWPAGSQGAQAAAGGVLLFTAALLIAAGYVAQRIVETTLEVQTGSRPYLALKRVFGWRSFWLLPPLLVVLGVGGAVVGAVKTGDERGQFSMVILVSVAVLLAATRLLDRFVGLVGERLRYAREEAPRVLAGVAKERE